MTTRAALKPLVLLVPLALAACGPEAVDPITGVDEAGPAVAFLSKDGLNGATCALVATGEARCHGWVKVDPDGRPTTNPTPAGLFPADLQAAYNLNVAAGAGVTVAIVDAYDNPKAESDLAVYRAQFGLPPCTTANGCFRKVDQNGGTKYPRGNVGWGEEIALDLDMVSAACPNCNILLVEADRATIVDLGTAVNTAVALGAHVVSNSYGGGESSSETNWTASYYDHPGVAVTVSSGDNGYGAMYPASSRTVIAVGGTRLVRASNARGWTESAWSGAGSGCSAFEPKPSWQADSGCANRTVADVSAVADPNTGVAVYDTYRSGGWMIFGGTSVAAPIVGAIYALNGGAVSYGADPYSRTSALYDVTSGSNGSCSGSYLCTSGAGYDGPTGLGTPNGSGAL